MALAVGMTTPEGEDTETVEAGARQISKDHMSGHSATLRKRPGNRDDPIVVFVARYRPHPSLPIHKEGLPVSVLDVQVSCGPVHDDRESDWVGLILEADELPGGPSQEGGGFDLDLVEARSKLVVS
jgi:hypothetical protein